MALVQVFVANPADPSPAAATALQRVQAAVARFATGVQVRVVSLDEPEALQLGITIEPAIMVNELVVAVGQAPPAGHIVRALEAALAREGTADG